MLQRESGSTLLGRDDDDNDSDDFNRFGRAKENRKSKQPVKLAMKVVIACSYQDRGGEVGRVGVIRVVSREKGGTQGAQSQIIRQTLGFQR